MEELKRNRSPNYPGVPLPEAVERALRLYEKTSRQEVNSEIAAKACGFKGLSGPSRRLLSAMGKYGLVSSKRGKVATTSRTRVLHYKGVASPEGRTELRSSILEAPLFSDLWEKRGAPDEQLVFDLVDEMGFSDAGAKRAVRCFRESMAFASLDVDAETDVELVEEVGDSAVDSLSREVSASRGPRATPGYEYSWPLSPNLRAAVSFSGPPRPEDVDALCDYLEVMKRQLARESREARD